MRKHKSTSNICFYVPYYDSWYWKFIGSVCAVLIILISCVILYFPVIKPNLEQQRSVLAQIEQGNADYVYGDVSEFSTHSNAYSQTQKYDGKIVSFTGRVGEIRETFDGEYGKSIISLDSDTLNEWCADCGINDIAVTDLEQMFSEGDKVVVIGEVYHSSWVIVLRNCRIELCDD